MHQLYYAIALSFALFVCEAHAQTMNMAAPGAQGLVGWWKSVQGRTGGRQWYDMLGRYTATLTNMATVTSGHAATTRPGGYGEVRLDGTDDYVLIPASTLLYPPAFTITLWLRRTSVGGNYQALISNSAGDQARTLFVRGGGGALINLLTTGSTCCYPDSGSSGPISVGPWHHLGWTYSSGIGTHLWHNCAVELLTQTPSGTAWQPINQTTLLGNTAPAAGNRYTGALDDVRIYNRAMSQQEVCTVMRESSQGDPQLLPPSLTVLLAPSRPTSNFFPFFQQP
jgi:Concanavalin A-like lectin/glucanases superfamily